MLRIAQAAKSGSATSDVRQHVATLLPHDPTRPNLWWRCQTTENYQSAWRLRASTGPTRPQSATPSEYRGQTHIHTSLPSRDEWHQESGWFRLPLKWLTGSGLLREKELRWLICLTFGGTCISRPVPHVEATLQARFQYPANEGVVREREREESEEIEKRGDIKTERESERGG